MLHLEESFWLQRGIRSQRKEPEVGLELEDETFG